MSLWPVQLPEWPESNFEKLVPESVLVEYDGPITFTFRDRLDNLMLAHAVGAGESVHRFVLAPSSTKIIGQLTTGAISVRGALDQPLIWLADVGPDGRLSKVWVTNLGALPEEVLPSPDVMLFPSLEPLIRLRALGQRIEPGSVPAALVANLTSGAENAVRKLVNWIVDRQQTGRPPEQHRQLYRLQAQQFAFNSFEIAFRPVEASQGKLIEDPQLSQVLAQVTEMLGRGLRWSQTGESPWKNAQEAEVILDAIMELSPRQGSAVTAIEVSGKVTESLSRPRPSLLQGTRQLAGTTIRELRRGRPQPEFVLSIGRIGAVDRDELTMIVRPLAEDVNDPERRFRFDAEHLDDVLDAFNAQYDIAAIGQPRTRGAALPELVALERLDDLAAETKEEPDADAAPA